MYVERYLQGEHEQVWAELQNLGSAIHQEELYQDAWSVVQETMRRVRHNLELLLPRLIECGFVFGYDARLAFFFKRPLPLYYPSEPIGMDTAYLEALDYSRQFPPVFLPGDLAQKSYENPLIPDMKRYVEQMEKEIGVLPLAIKAWYELVGGVNLYGFHPVWAQWYCEHITCNDDYYDLMQFCDPLFVAPLKENWHKSVFSYQLGIQEELTSIFQFAPDVANKDLCAGAASPYVFVVPDPHVDATLLHLHTYVTEEGKPLTFVQYLRLCFAWAGFPGMAKWNGFPKEIIADLTRDFLPF